MATGALAMAAELGTEFFAFMLYGEEKQRSVLKAGRSENKRCLWRHHREEQKIIIKGKIFNKMHVLLLVLGYFLNHTSTFLFLDSSAASPSSIHSLIFSPSFFHYSSYSVSKGGYYQLLIFLLMCNCSMLTCQVSSSFGRACIVIYLV